MMLPPPLLYQPVFEYAHVIVMVIQGATIIDQSHDQETTDLHKCLRFIKDFTGT
jgi:hypothetical protein